MRLREAVLVPIAVMALSAVGLATSASAPERQGKGAHAEVNKTPQLRVVTYNIRSCEGLDGHYRCDRIADILRRVGADVIALQEVRAEQAAEIAQRLGYHVFFGHADIVHGYNFGNAILTRIPIRETYLYPIGVPGRQQRAVLRVDVAWPGASETLHVFTVHLGLSVAERREQAKRLASPQILEDPSIQNEPRILVGDFNEKFNHQDVNQSLKPLLQLTGRKSWPAFLPFIDLDRIYISSDMKRRSAHVYISFHALFASDHLPLVAVLEKTRPAAEGPRTGMRSPAASMTGESYDVHEVKLAGDQEVRGSRKGKGSEANDKLQASEASEYVDDAKKSHARNEYHHKHASVVV